MNQLQQVELHHITPYCSQEQTNGNVLVKPVANRPFIERLSQSRAVITSAGFETCTEAMFLEKNLMVIHIKYQYVHSCNYEAINENVETELLQEHNTIHQF